eukprot:363785-Chlamydomonas_euryale.AAC.7
MGATCRSACSMSVVSEHVCATGVDTAVWLHARRDDLRICLADVCTGTFQAPPLPPFGAAVRVWSAAAGAAE